MRKKAIVILMATLFLTGMLVVGIPVGAISPRILVVPSEDYPTIQSAIDDAIDDQFIVDIIQVLPGIYYEHVTIDKSVQLLGSGCRDTVIDGGGDGDVINIDYISDLTSPKTVISGFTIRNGENGIHVMSTLVINISYNVIRNNYRGIWLQGSEAIQCQYHWIITNIISNNEIGMDLEYASDILVHGGNVISNNLCGVQLDHSSNNIIRNNNFINNDQQVINYGPTGWGNDWDYGYANPPFGGGNYWSDQNHGDCADHYSGYSQDEPGSDGFVDTPYEIDVDNIDRFPLMSERTREIIDAGLDQCYMITGVDSMIDLVDSYYADFEIDDPDVVIGLLDKLDAARISIQANRMMPAGNQLGAFENQVLAQEGNHITQEAADTLISNVNYVINVIA